jgi:radical SAM protein with 4Fe4S-binding SPASM domain
MDRGLFERILVALRGYCRLLHFHVLGEPLLHTEIGGFLDSCASSGYRVNIVTNGVLLPISENELLGKSALRQVSISLHHLSEGLPPSALDQYFRGIKAFVHKAGEYPELFISLRLWNMQSRLDAPFWDDITHRIADLFSLSPSSIAHCNEENPLQLSKNIWLNCAARFDWPSLEGPSLGDRGTCLGLRQQIAILVDGTVVPCCLDGNGVIALGNIASDSLNDILAGQRAAALKEGFCNGRLTEDLCKRCIYRFRFEK